MGAYDEALTTGTVNPATMTNIGLAAGEKAAAETPDKIPPASAADVRAEAVTVVKSAGLAGGVSNSSGSSHQDQNFTAEVLSWENTLKGLMDTLRANKGGTEESAGNTGMLTKNT